MAASLMMAARSAPLKPGVARAMKMNKDQRAAYLVSRKAHIISIIQQGLKP